MSKACRALPQLLSHLARLLQWLMRRVLPLLPLLPPPLCLLQLDDCRRSASAACPRHLKPHCLGPLQGWLLGARMHRGRPW